MSVEPVNEGLDGWLVQVPQVGRGLSGLLTQHHRLRVDQSKRVDYHLALDALDGIDHHCHRTLIERLKTLLLKSETSLGRCRVTGAPVGC